MLLFKCILFARDIPMPLPEGVMTVPVHAGQCPPPRRGLFCDRMIRDQKGQVSRRTRMYINRSYVKEAFQIYVSGYDLSDVKVQLKVDHTYRVAALCDAITASLADEFSAPALKDSDGAGSREKIALPLSEEKRNLVWLAGMLHDIGRFEQLRRYHTFQDRDSCNHAALSADILFREGKIQLFEDPLQGKGEKGNMSAGESVSGIHPARGTVRQADRWQTRRPQENHGRDHALLEKAIRLHNVYQLPYSLSPEEYLLTTVLRDADKIDILRVNCETPRTEICDLPEEAFRSASITDAVLDDVLSCRSVNRAHSKTGIDFLIGHIAFVFGLVYPESLRQVRKQGYLRQLLDFRSDNPDTRRKMKLIAETVDRYIDQKTQA